LKLTVEKLIVRVDIANVRVSPLNKGDYQIDQLELAVAVDNLRQNDALSNCLVSVSALSDARFHHAVNGERELLRAFDKAV
jgi:hypothetical protein